MQGASGRRRTTLEKLVKQYFWLFHVAMVALVAFLCARVVSNIGGHVVAGLLAADEGGQKTKRSAPDRGVRRNFDEASEYNIFGAFREVLKPVAIQTKPACKSDEDCAENLKCLPVENPAEGEPAKQCQSADPANIDLANAVKSDLPLKLVGTSVFSFPEDSLATIVDLGGGRSAQGELYSINACADIPPAPPEPPVDEDAPKDLDAELRALERDTRPKAAPCNVLLEEHKLLRIDVDRVYVHNTEQNRAEYISLDEPPEAPRTSRAKKPRKKKAEKKPGKKGKDDEFGAGITKVGANSYEITQTEVNKALGNLSKIATKARIVPAFEGGKSIGFKLFSIRPGSVYSKIGIQNGDIIQKVNGYDLNSPDKALELYQKLKDGKEFSVDIKRRGKPVTLDYGIVP